jgi:hypothetical protein
LMSTDTSVGLTSYSGLMYGVVMCRLQGLEVETRA